MTDKELCIFGESLYRAVRETPLPLGSIHALATAVQNDVPWSRLPGQLKVVVFKIAASTLKDAASLADEQRDDDDGDDTAVLIPPPAGVPPRAASETRPTARGAEARANGVNTTSVDDTVATDQGAKEPATAA